MPDLVVKCYPQTDNSTEGSLQILHKENQEKFSEGETGEAGENKRETSVDQGKAQPAKESFLHHSHAF